MKRFLIIWIISCMAALAVYSQEPAFPQYLEGIRVGNDTLPHIDLQPINVFPKATFNSKQEEQQYWRLVSKVKKVYPYAKEAGRLYLKYQQEVPPTAKRRDRRIYVKKAEDELMKLYGPKLKQMTISEGSILIKLIDRETHATPYDLIDQVKGGVPAIFWQGVARIFGNSLKSHYDPNGEDRQIERIIRYIEAGMI